VDGSNVAPVGSWVVDRVMVLPGLRSVVVTVKLIHDPVVAVRFPGTVRVIGLEVGIGPALKAKLYQSTLTELTR
jgi:hypothetical protein